MRSRLTAAACLPDDRDRAMLIGRVWLPAAAGPALVRVTAIDVHDLSGVAATASGLLALDDPVGAIRGASALPRIGTLAEILANSAANDSDDRLPWFLAPCDLQAIKAAGVTFVASMLERVIEEQARGDPAKAEAVRAFAGRADRRRSRAMCVPVRPRRARLKEVLLAAGCVVAVSRSRHRTGRRDLHQVAADVGGRRRCARSASIRSRSGTTRSPRSCWRSNGRGRTVGATLGNDVNLRDFEGRSALLLGKAKDNNASCAIGPFIRLFDEHFGIDDVRRCELAMRVDGPEGFALDGTSSMAMISRDPLELVAQAIGPNHQYPDGLVLFLGTMFAPTKDRHRAGAGLHARRRRHRHHRDAEAGRPRQPRRSLRPDRAVDLRHGRAHDQSRARGLL